MTRISKVDGVEGWEVFGMGVLSKQLSAGGNVCGCCEVEEVLFGACHSESHVRSVVGAWGIYVSRGPDLREGRMKSCLPGRAIA